MKLHKFSTFDSYKPAILIYMSGALYSKTIQAFYFEIYFKYFRRIYGKTHNIVLATFSCGTPKKSIVDSFDGAILVEGFYKDIAKMRGRTYYQVVGDEFKKIDLAALKIEKLFTINQLFFDFLKSIRNNVIDIEAKHKFVITVKGYVGIAGAVWLGENLNLTTNQLVIDPDEVFLDSYGLKVNNWFFYDSKIFNCRALNVCEDHYQHDDRFKKLAAKEKTKDIVIGYTNLGNRKTMRKIDFNKIREQVLTLNHKILCKDKDTGEDSFIPKNQYDQLISESRFTIIFPSYNVRAFSTIRFLDAIANRCTPLILKSCETSEMFSTAEEKELCQKLIVTEDTLRDKILELRDSTIINDLHRVFIEQKSITRTIQ